MWPMTQKKMTDNMEKKYFIESSKDKKYTVFYMKKNRKTEKF